MSGTTKRFRQQLGLELLLSRRVRAERDHQGSRADVGRAEERRPRRRDRDDDVARPSRGPHVVDRPGLQPLLRRVAGEALGTRAVEIGDADPPDPPGGGQRVDLPAPLASGSDEQRRLGVGPRERAGDHRRDRRGAQAGHDRRVEQGGRHPGGRIGDEDRAGEPLAGLAVEGREAPVQLRPDDSARPVEGDSARRQVEGAAPEPVQVEPSRTEGASLAVGPERLRDRVDAVRKRRQLERVAPCEDEHAPMPSPVPPQHREEGGSWQPPRPGRSRPVDPIGSQLCLDGPVNVAVDVVAAEDGENTVLLEHRGDGGLDACEP